MNSSHPANAGPPPGGASVSGDSVSGDSVSGASASGDALRVALSAWAAGVTLLTIADGRDDIGTTVSAFMPVSLDPPLVAVSLIASAYPAEVLAGPPFPRRGSP